MLCRQTPPARALDIWSDQSLASRASPVNKTLIRISWPSGELVAYLEATPTAEAVLRVLPCESDANTWGDEVYFSIPVTCRLESGARQVVDAGSVCFWVEGKSLALPFGPTPISHGNECRLVTKVNILGRIEGDPRLLSSVRAGERIRIERV